MKKVIVYLLGLLAIALASCTGTWYATDYDDRYSGYYYDYPYYNWYSPYYYNYWDMPYRYPRVYYYVPKTPDVKVVPPTRRDPPRREPPSTITRPRVTPNIPRSNNPPISTPRNNNSNNSNNSRRK